MQSLLYASSGAEDCGETPLVEQNEESPLMDDTTEDPVESHTIRPSERVAMVQFMAASLVPDIKEYMRERFAINKLALERRIAAEERHHLAIMAAEERRLANEERHRGAIMAVEEQRVLNEEQHRIAMRAAIQHDTVTEQQYKAAARAGEQQRRADQRNACAAQAADEQATRKWILLRGMAATLPHEEMQRQMFQLIDARPSHHRRISKGTLNQ